VSSFITSKRAALDRRDTQQVFTPDVSQWNQKYVAFLGINPNLSADKLCVPYTRQVMGVYTTQLGNQQPYTSGLQTAYSLPASKVCALLSTQNALLHSSATKCRLLVASRPVQHHVRQMVALRLLVRRLLPPPPVPLHFYEGELFELDGLMLICRCVFIGDTSHSHRSFPYLSRYSIPFRILL
jgi:hypothetical protein